MRGKAGPRMGEGREIPLPIEVESLGFRDTLARPTVVTGDHGTMSSHSLKSKGTHIHTTEKLTIARTNDTRVHQPLHLQQSGGVW